MQKIPVLRAKAGMVVFRDVFRGESSVGMPVCSKGTVLTDALLTRLEQMDIQTLYVHGHPVWEEGEQSLDDLYRDLDSRFQKVMDDPLTAKLYGVYKAFLARSTGD